MGVLSRRTLAAVRGAGCGLSRMLIVGAAGVMNSRSRIGGMIEPPAGLGRRGTAPADVVGDADPGEGR